MWLYTVTFMDCYWCSTQLKLDILSFILWELPRIWYVLVTSFHMLDSILYCWLKNDTKHLSQKLNLSISRKYHQPIPWALNTNCSLIFYKNSPPAKKIFITKISSLNSLKFVKRFWLSSRRIWPVNVIINILWLYTQPNIHFPKATISQIKTTFEVHIPAQPPQWNCFLHWPLYYPGSSNLVPVCEWNCLLWPIQEHHQVMYCTVAAFQETGGTLYDLLHNKPAKCTDSA